MGDEQFIEESSETKCYEDVLLNLVRINGEKLIPPVRVPRLHKGVFPKI